MCVKRLFVVVVDVVVVVVCVCVLERERERLQEIKRNDKTGFYRKIEEDSYLT